MAIFSLLPVVMLILAAETAVRFLALNRTALATPGIGSFGREDSIAQVDADLGWSMRPHLRPAGGGAADQIVTNSLGLRSPEVSPKVEGELRILSLGESTTLGIGVAAAATYSAKLQEVLGQALLPRTVTVINAGMSAYSSFQSLKYLKTRGVKLQPDIVLFYHELNDYLPSTLRDPAQNEGEILLTDKQIYGSRLIKLSRVLQTRSALYRFAFNEYTQRRVRTLLVSPSVDRWQLKSPLEEIGIGGRVYNPLALPQVVSDDGTQRPATEIHPFAIGRRVSAEERLDNLRELVDFCRDRGIRLVIMHPSYQSSTRHECILTRFCAEARVPLFETYDILHPAAAAPGGSFIDFMHPNPAGHEALADHLSRFILELPGQAL